MTLSIRLALYALLVAGIFSAGWQVRGWKNDSEQAAVDRAAQAIADKASQRESDFAGQLEQKLATLKANQTVIDRGVIREIQKPIYQRVCLEPDAVSLLNAAARGEAPTTTGQPAGGVPGPTARAK